MCQTVKLHVKNFGPITDACLEIGKYTVLIGDQGSGKSSLAKIFTLFIWLEKVLIRHIISVKQLKQGSFAQKKFCHYHRISSYFTEETYLSFEGVHFQFTYENSSLEVSKQLGKEALDVAKVMYVPAERNFLSTLDNPRLMKGFPEALDSFLEEFENAKADYPNYVLPLHNMAFEYDRQNKISWLKGNNYRLHLTDASSGYQSLLPLCLVTHYLTQLVYGTADNNLNIAERLKLQKEVEAVMVKKDISEEVRDAMLKTISVKFKYSSFVNVVEEMEQNLYPTSQKEVLYYLLSKCNELESNKLLLTTHSPYLINYLALAVKAFQIDVLAGRREDIRGKMKSIVPFSAYVDPKDVRIYELTDNGIVYALKTNEGIPSDNNYLNNLLGQTNDLYNDLLDIEEQCQL